MGNAGGRCRPSQPRPQPTVPTAAAGAVAIPSGAELTASWQQLQRYRGVTVRVANVGRAPCELLGAVLPPGRDAVIALGEGETFTLRVRSTEGTSVRLEAVAAARRSLVTRKKIERDPKTHLITGVIEEPVWIEHAARNAAAAGEP
jgi:hypothetical protein